MKTAVILLGLFVVLVAAEEECPLLKALKQGFEECKESLKPSDEILELVSKDQGENNKEVQCFQACTAVKAGLMNDAKFDIEKMESLLRSAENPNEEKIKAVVQLMTECKEEAEVTNDECEVAGNYLKCTNAKRDAEMANE